MLSIYFKIPDFSKSMIMHATLVIPCGQKLKCGDGSNNISEQTTRCRMVGRFIYVNEKLLAHVLFLCCSVAYGEAMAAFRKRG